jgi:flagellar hook-associated protein 1 FlgK
MSSTFGGISTALSGLVAARKAMDVTGQNITNVATTGYTRRSTMQEGASATGQSSLYGPGDMAGNGVTVVGTSRASDGLLDAGVRSASADSALSSGRSATLAGLEGLTTEPTDQGLAKQMDDMWKTWGDLSNHPDSLAVRQTVVTATQTVVDAIRSGHDAVATQWSTELSKANATVDSINTTASDVAGLNKQIAKIVGAGGDANDLMDQRDQLVTTLSTMTGATAQAGSNGQVNVYVNGHTMVGEGTAWTLQHVTNSAGTSAPPPAMGSAPTLQWAGTPATTAALTSGSLAASMEALTTTLPAAAAKYDTLASNLATGVNTVLTGSSTSVYDLAGNAATNLFQAAPPNDPTDPITASNLSLAFTDASLLGASAIAPSDGSQTYDGSVADLISKLGSDLTVTDANGDPSTLTSPNTTWKTWVADLGTRASSATLNATMSAHALATASSDQQSNAGVSLDEETANLLLLQHAYQGAARVMSAVDEMLDTLINNTGS